jgi:glycerophosphoryl diester phosphodiesterase
MIVVGHRGACGHAPENTLKSFAKAIEMGCQRVEFDVHLSQDGIPVVIHDPTVDRTTNGKGSVNSFRLVDLKKLDAGEGEQVPILAEVMDFCRGKAEIQIELKDPDSPSAVADLIKEGWGLKDVVVTSFDLSLLKQFAKQMPGIPLGLLNKDPNLDMVSVALGHGHQWICPRFDLATRGLVDKAHQAGLLIYVYQVNDRKTATEIDSWNVEAIGTDFPELVFNLPRPRNTGKD